MSFISASWHNYGKIIVWSKNEAGKRVHKIHDPVYYFYVPNPEGEFIAIDETPVSKVVFANKQDFEMGTRQYQQKYESDFPLVERTLMDNYLGKPLPVLNVAFIDIEVDYKPEIGWSSVNNPYAPVNALTMYKTQSKEYVTLAIPPPDWDGVWPDELKHVLLCENEKELLESFLQLLEDVDIISGWNSEFFDLPYLAVRIERVLGPSAVKKLNFPESIRPPQWKEVEKFGVKNKIVELEGRVHIDYLKLFKKFNLAGRPSFSLAAVADDELDVPKLKYEGSLADLYKNDFIHFVKYNIRDTEILAKLDTKFKYIQLANSMVHEATVNFSAVFGTVTLVDTAIANYSHKVLNRVLFDKKHIPGERVEGAVVLNPKLGLARWIFSCDINSLYPSVYRSLNLSPEKIRGQFTRNELDWHQIYNRTEQTCALVTIDGDYIEGTGAEWREILAQKKWAVSAYGTVLDQGNGEGLLSSVLSYWFKGRKELQGEKKKWSAKADAIAKEKGKDNPEWIEANTQAEYYDMLQGVRKVLLNSTYGATLNQYCRFHDPRLGASTTATGRQITTFMINTIGNLISGNDTKLVKHVSSGNPESDNFDDDGPSATYTYDGDEIIYGDTDSCYASLASLNLTKDEYIAVADEIVNQTNDLFPAFMNDAFGCIGDFSKLIRANREVVAETGIFQAKKKYMLNIVNLEGKDIPREDKKSFKSMGGDIKTSTTPDKIKDFLKSVAFKILYDVDKKEIEDYIVEFRNGFDGTHDNSIDPLELATQGSAKVLEAGYQKWLAIEKPGLGKVNLPGHIRAAINYNESLKRFNDKESPSIISGSKIKTLYLKENAFNFKSMAFPADIDKLPKWFTDNFQVNLQLMEDKLIDAKLENIFHALQWQVPTKQSQFINSVFSF